MCEDLELHNLTTSRMPSSAAALVLDIQVEPQFAQVIEQLRSDTWKLSINHEITTALCKVTSCNQGTHWEECSEVAKAVFLVLYIPLWFLLASLRETLQLNRVIHSFTEHLSLSFWSEEAKHCIGSIQSANKSPLRGQKWRHNEWPDSLTWEDGVVSMHLSFKHAPVSALWPIILPIIVFECYSETVLSLSRSLWLFKKGPVICRSVAEKAPHRIKTSLLTSMQPSWIRVWRIKGDGTVHLLSPQMKCYDNALSVVPAGHSVHYRNMHSLHAAPELGHYL